MVAPVSSVNVIVSVGRATSILKFSVASADPPGASAVAVSVAAPALVPAVIVNWATPSASVVTAPPAGAISTPVPVTVTTSPATTSSVPSFVRTAVSVAVSPDASESTALPLSSVRVRVISQESGSPLGLPPKKPPLPVPSPLPPQLTSAVASSEINTNRVVRNHRCVIVLSPYIYPAGHQIDTANHTTGFSSKVWPNTRWNNEKIMLFRGYRGAVTPS